MFKKIIKWLKVKVDKIYYSVYTTDEWTLIREMFPWINSIWEYKHINTFLRNNRPSDISLLMNVITAYYWWEVKRLTEEGNFQTIERYQWLLDFIQDIRDYQAYLVEQSTAEEDN